MAEALPEVWLRGRLENIPALLQPAAHALLQAMEEMNVLMKEFPEHLLWERPAGVASPGFHLLHITGVLNRLCTYARAGLLNEEQLAYLKSESERQDRSVSELIEMLQRQVNQTLKQFSETDESTLTELRSVGRKGLPSTVQGLLFHAAEHTMRHLGQLLVTVKILKAGSST